MPTFPTFSIPTPIAIVGVSNVAKPTAITSSTPKYYFKHQADIPDLALDDLIKNVPIAIPKLSKADEMAIHVEKVRALLKNNIVQIEIMKKELNYCFDVNGEDDVDNSTTPIEALSQTVANEFEELISQITPTPEQLGTIKQVTSRLLSVLPKSKSTDILSALFG
jgi:hypothetical protein